MVIGVDRALVRVPHYACLAGALYGGLLRGGVEAAQVDVRIVGVEPRPRDVARATRADAPGSVAVPERTVVAGGGVRADVTGHQVRAVEKVAVLVDAETQIGTDQPVVRRVSVRAGVSQASTPGTDAIAVAVGGARDRAGVQLIVIYQIETDAVRTVTA